MIAIKILFIFLTFTISSCGLIEKDTPSVDPMEDNLIFVGEVSGLTQQKVKDISENITQQLVELKEFCKKTPNLQEVKNFTGQLVKLQRFAKQSYDGNAYSFNNIKVKDGDKSVNLGIYLLEINSILNSSYPINYDSIRGSTLKETCSKLKNNYRLSYASYYNLADNIKITDHMAFLFRNIDDSIKCLCK